MEEKVITIVVLPYSKAVILKMQLEAKKIDCNLKNVNLIEGAVSSTVSVEILEKDLAEAIPVLDEFLGKKPESAASETDPKERHILVPVDFSPGSEKACKMAFNIASHLQTGMVIMHSYINPLIHSIPFSDVYTYDSSLLAKLDVAEKTANEDFQKFITKMVNNIGLEKWQSVPIDFVIKSGYPDEDILAYSNENRSQLIVIGRTGRAADPGTVGSVTADIMYNAKMPVLIVPENTPDRELEEFSTVLYATNFDEKDFTAIDKLMSILYPFNIKVICVHVGQTDKNTWDMAKLNGMRDILIKKYRSEIFDCRLIESDNILESLDFLIKQENIDIISLTTHKRNMISRLFNPSLARKMAFHVNTPLLIFHA